MSTPEHTPGPYTQERHFVESPKGIMAKALCPGLYPTEEVARANAAFIVRAANNHEALVDTLTKAKKAIYGYSDRLETLRLKHEAMELGPLLNEITAALKSATS